MSNEIKRDTKASFNALPLTVIVAEKYPIARAALAALLTYDGYRVFQAEDLKAAMFCITNSVDDLAVLLVDLDMLGWRSIVRHAVKTTRALVIAMEGNQPLSAINDWKERGIRVCLRKPIIYEDLRAAIRENIEVSNTSELPPNESGSDGQKRFA
jgi:DNA-binding response OmpR family regulator